MLVCLCVCVFVYACVYGYECESVVGDFISVLWYMMVMLMLVLVMLALIRDLFFL